MNLGIRRIYRRVLAGIMLFTAETLLAIVLFLLAFTVFLFVARYVFLENKSEFDSTVFHLLQNFVSDQTTRIMVFFTHFGNYQILVTANVLLTCYFLFIRKHRWYSIKIPSIALSSVIVMTLLKMFFNRPRPLTPLLEPARGLSFPSGHAMSAVTFFGLIIYFIYRNQSNKPAKILMITGLVLFILMIGLSRVYLRVHYASDVLAGFSAGIIWLIIAIWSLRKIEFHSKHQLNHVVENPPTQ